MKVGVARWIDYWIGIPICLVLSFFYRIKKIFSSQKKSKPIQPKKVLFLELTEMGSTILAYPAMKKIKELYPEAELFYWIFKENEESIQILNLIPRDKIITMRRDNPFLFVVDTVKNVWRVRKEGIDVIIDLELFLRFTSILSFLSGAAVRVGFYKYLMEGLYRGQLVTHKVVYNPYMHISCNFLSLVYSLEFFPGELPVPKKQLTGSPLSLLKIELSEKSEKNIWDKLKSANAEVGRENKIVVLNPGASEFLPLRKWPVENYVKLAKRLLDDKSVYVVLIGLQKDVPLSECVMLEINSKQCIDLTGKTTLNELIDLFNISRLLISHDSGPPNFAALTGINIIVLFGPETPVLYAPLSDSKTVIYKELACSPCVSAYNHRRSLCKDNKCLQAISVDEVFAAAEKYLYS